MEEAVTREGKVDTSLVYSIHLLSGLPRELLLGQIWALANKKTPGQLVSQELFMISIAQNNMDVSQLEVLVPCSQAPIPNLGQNQPSDVPFAAEVSPANQAQAHAPPLANQEPPDLTANQQTGQGFGATQAVSSVDDKFDDFADFQQAPMTSSTSFADLSTQPSQLLHSYSMPAGVASIATGGSSEPITTGALHAGIGAPSNEGLIMGEEDKYSAFRTLADEDFKVAAPSLQSNTIPSNPPAAENSTDFLTDSSAFAANFSSSMPAASFSVGGKEEEFADLTCLSSASVPSQLQSSTLTAGSVDKLAALKALVSDQSLYTAQKEADVQKEAGIQNEAEADDEWANLRATTNGKLAIYDEGRVLLRG